jgi:hypothetical protein
MNLACRRRMSRLALKAWMGGTGARDRAMGAWFSYERFRQAASPNWRVAILLPMAAPGSMCYLMVKAAILRPQVRERRSPSDALVCPWIGAQAFAGVRASRRSGSDHHVVISASAWSDGSAAPTD